MKINTSNFNFIERINFDRLRDIRFTGQIIFVFLVLLISWSGVKAIQTNYGLQKQVATLSQQNEIQGLENENIALQNKYYQSNQYLELSARQNFGLANAGEQELLVPEKVALSYTVTPPDSIKESTQAAPLSSTQKNFESWVDFFSHRSQN